MKKLLQRIVPKPLIKVLKKITVSLVGNEKINNIDLLMNMVYDMYPPLIIINRNVYSSIVHFRDKYGISDKLNTDVSKSDFMFRFLLIAYKGDFRKSFYEYLECGLNSFNIINKLVVNKFGNLKNVKSILDFASGHGRLERFLILNYPANCIWVSDIKESANEFQTKHFGVNSIASTFEPEEYTPNQKFDIIYVGSLFSHLPEDLFETWLLKLYSLISDNGILIVSTHNIDSFAGNTKKDFVYLNVSEDTLMPEIEESIEDTDKYGCTYISEKRFFNMLNKNGIESEKCSVYRRALGRFQDIYVLTKDNFQFDTKLRLDSYP